MKVNFSHATKIVQQRKLLYEKHQTHAENILKNNNSFASSREQNETTLYTDDEMRHEFLKYAATEANKNPHSR